MATDKNRIALKGRLDFVNDQFDDVTVAVIDAKKLEVIKYLLVGQRVWQLAFTPDQKKLYATNGVSNDVSIIDVDSLTVTKSIGVGRYPWGVAVKP